MAVKGQVPEFVSFFQDVDDPRRDNANRYHDLIDIIFIAVAAVVSGCDGWTEIANFGRAKEKFLKRFLTLPNGIPSHDTFGRIFSILDPEQFRTAFGQFIAAVTKLAPREVVAIDGKALRRSHDATNGKSMIHMVSAWATANKVVLGQIKTDEKSNEITAIPELLTALDLKDAIITIDAMGCQKDIAEKIVDEGADYVLALKGNQNTLHADAEHFFSACILEDFKTGGWSSFSTEESAHGRFDKRTIHVTQELDDLSTASEWKGLKSLIVIDRERTVNGVVEQERRYYISSLSYKGKKFGEIIRAHWGIENSLHWVLDVAFREDESRVRQGHAAENLSMLRQLAANMIRQTPIGKYKGGVRTRRMAAALDEEYLLEILGHASEVL